MKIWLKAYDRAIRAISQVNKTLLFMTGFNVNIDAVKHVKKDDIERALRYVSPVEIIKKISEPPMKVNSIEDFLAGLLFCLKEGLGEEWIITNAEVIKKLEGILGWDEVRMGGQGGNMSNVLATLGQIVIPNVPSLPRQQAYLFYDRNVVIPVLIDGKVRFKAPSEAVRPSDPPLIHWISEFRKGLTVRLGDLEFEVPRDNRFIATFDDVNTRLQLAPGFWEGSILRARRAVAAAVSGYHLLMDKYPDGTTCNDALKKIVALIKSWKRINPELAVHAEMGFTTNRNVRKAIISMIFPHVDSIGVNETELYMFHSPIQDKIPNLYSATDLYSKARELMKKHGLKRVFVHTREYSISLLRGSYGICPEKELMALLFGAALAATLAATGKPPTIKDVEKAMRQRAFKISEEGLEEQKKLASFLDSEGETRFRSFIKKGFTDEEPYVIFIPSLLVKNVRATVGLGDTLCAGTLAGEQLLRRN